MQTSKTPKASIGTKKNGKIEILQLPGFTNYVKTPKYGSLLPFVKSTEKKLFTNNSSNFEPGTRVHTPVSDSFPGQLTNTPTSASPNNKQDMDELFQNSLKEKRMRQHEQQVIKKALEAITVGHIMAEAFCSLLVPARSPIKILVNHSSSFVSALDFVKVLELFKEVSKLKSLLLSSDQLTLFDLVESQDITRSRKFIEIDRSQNTKKNACNKLQGPGTSAFSDLARKLLKEDRAEPRTNNDEMTTPKVGVMIKKLPIPVATPNRRAAENNQRAQQTDVQKAITRLKSNGNFHPADIILVESMNFLFSNEK